MNMHNPPHPGEVLREWLEGVTATDAAARLGVTRVAFSRILNGAAGISAEMDGYPDFSVGRQLKHLLV